MDEARNHSSPSLTAIGVFLIFGITMAAFAGATLLLPGTSLDRLWRLNPTAHAQLLPVARVIGPGFLLLAAVMAAAAVGWFKHQFWGWVLTVAIIATQVVGDAVNLIRGDYLRGAVGVIIAGLLLVYLCRPAMRNVFQRQDARDNPTVLGGPTRSR